MIEIGQLTTTTNSILNFADSSRVPRFKFVEMQNHTVRVGSEATFACIVEYLGGYKVNAADHSGA